MIGFGYVFYSNSNFYTARESTSGNAVVKGSQNCAVIFSAATYYIRRCFYPFDYTGIPTGEIVSAKLGIYISYLDNQDDDGNDTFTVLESTQASLTDLTTADYNDASTTIPFSDSKDFGTLSLNNWNEFELNAAALIYLNTQETAKLAIREGHDWNNEKIVSRNETNVESAYLELTFAAEEEPPVATTTTDIAWQDDLTKIIAWEFTYDGTNTNATTSIKQTVYDIPFIKWLLLAVPLIWVSNLLIKEYILKLRSWITR
jgi:hypothetical protein